MNTPDEPLQLEFEIARKPVRLQITPDSWRKQNGVMAIVECSQADAGCVFVKLLPASTASLLETLRVLDSVGMPEVLAVTEYSAGNCRGYCLVTEFVRGKIFSDFALPDLRSLDTQSLENLADLLSTTYGNAIQCVLDVIPNLCSRGWFYRDLSLKNLMVDPQTGRVALIDLDSCCALGKETGSGFEQSFTVLAANRLLGIQGNSVGQILRNFGFKRSVQKTPLGTPSRAQASLVSFALYLLLRYQLQRKGQVKQLRSILRQTPISCSPFKHLLKLDRQYLEQYLGIQAHSALMESLHGWRAAARSTEIGDWTACQEAVRALQQLVTGKRTLSHLENVVRRWMRIFAEIGETAEATIDNALDSWPLALDKYRSQLAATDYADVFTLRSELNDAVKARDDLMFWLDRWTTSENNVQREVCAELICGEFGASCQRQLFPACRQTIGIRARCDKVKEWWMEVTRTQSVVSEICHKLSRGNFRDGMILLQRYQNKASNYSVLQDLFREDIVNDSDTHAFSQFGKLAEDRRKRRFLALFRVFKHGGYGVRAKALQQESSEIMYEHEMLLKQGHELLRQGELKRANSCFEHALQLVSDSTAGVLGLEECHLLQVLHGC